MAPSEMWALPSLDVVHIHMLRIVSNADSVPARAFCKCLIYMAGHVLAFARLPVCGQRATALSRCLNLRHFGTFVGLKAGARATRGHGRVLPCAAEQDRAEIVEASRAGLE